MFKVIIIYIIFIYIYNNNNKMEDNKEYDSNLLNSMEDIYERENELLNNSNEENKNIKIEKKENVINESKMSKYYTKLKFSLIKYKNMILILLIYVILNMKQLEEFITLTISKFKLSENMNMMMTNILKGLLFLLIIYLLGLKVIF